MKQQSGLRKKFHVILTGKTNGAHVPIVKKVKSEGHQEVNSPDGCDYLLVFCPAVSRVQSDIENGLSAITADKPIILVVMHHTFNPNHIIAESRKQVKNQNVLLTVDYLFYKEDLLNCKLNVGSWADIQRFLQNPIKLESSSLLPKKHDSHGGNAAAAVSPSRSSYGSIQGVDGQQPTVQDHEARAGSWRKFFVIVTGTTNGAHKSVVNKLKRYGLEEVKSSDGCDFLLVFCTVVSRVQSDIQCGLSTITANKPILLVVMHHTFDANHIIAESRRQVTNPNVFLTVDFLFHQQKLHNCNCNNASYCDIQRFLGGPTAEDSSTCGTCMDWWWKISLIASILAVISLVIVLADVLKDLLT